MRPCDALGYTTPHHLFPTHTGDYWLCGVTGQLQRDQFPSEPAHHYDAHWELKLHNQQDIKTDVAQWKRHLLRYERYRQTGRLLEVASGQGRLLRAAVELGWDAVGNDISPVVADHAQKLSGSPFLVGPIEKVTLEPDSFDVIILNNVFEHLESPMTVLRQLVAALRPGGVMFLQTLSAQSLSMWAQGPDWYYFDRGHLYVPTHVSMAHYFRRAKLRVVDVSTHGYRSGSTRKTAQRSILRQCCDKVVGNLASLTRTGTRVRYVLHRPQYEEESR
jgi:2-polyprenyl-3-methyl-5-hydroxy-6-metoxy-1,4-benzoquinol methylase